MSIRPLEKIIEDFSLILLARTNPAQNWINRSLVPFRIGGQP